MDALPTCTSKAIKSRERLGLEQIRLWQLHCIDPKVPRDEQFAAVKSLLDDGIMRHAGLTDTISSIAAAKMC
jgi:aryl-alcohol dehydrogenase-like predicted oxidoreductase